MDKKILKTFGTSAAFAFIINAGMLIGANDASAIKKVHCKHIVSENNIKDHWYDIDGLTRDLKRLHWAGMIGCGLSGPYSAKVEWTKLTPAEAQKICNYLILGTESQSGNEVQFLQSGGTGPLKGIDCDLT